MCHLPEEQFPEVFNGFVRQGRNLFWDRGANILAVGHLDSVQKCTHAFPVFFPHKQLFYSPVLDDRLGVHVILNELIDLPYDILLTTDEETGNSSAKEFTTDKKYNWIFEWDRKGTDVVMYSFEDADMRKLLTSYDFKIGSGSYTDISSLNKLGCKAFNFGVAYYDYHSLDGYCNLKELQEQIKKFRKFFEEQKDNLLVHKYVEPKFPTFDRYNSRSYFNDNYYGSDYGAYITKGKNKAVLSYSVLPNGETTNLNLILTESFGSIYVTSNIGKRLEEWITDQILENDACICERCGAIFVPPLNETSLWTGMYCKICNKAEKQTA